MYRKITAGILAFLLTFGGAAVLPEQVYEKMNPLKSYAENGMLKFDNYRYTYTVLSDETVEITSYYGNAATVKIPDYIDGREVTSIGNGAFWSQDEVVSVLLPKSIRHIGKLAFSRCKNLKNINLQNGITEIMDSTFSNCESLESIEIPKSVVSIGDGAFYNCNKLKDIQIPENVISIDKNAFANCYELKSIRFPESVESIGETAFLNCENLAEVSAGKNILYAGKDSFYNTAWFNNHEDGVCYIGSLVYGYAGEMPENTSIVLENGSLSISDCAFKNNKNLCEVIMPDSVKYVGREAFSSCYNLRNIKLSANLEEIAPYAFEWCQSLSELEIPDKITIIEEGAVSNCRQLQSVKLPDGVTEVRRKAFGGCKKLSEINIPESLRYIGAYAYSNTDIESFSYPDGIDRIEERVFYNCPSLKEFSMSDSVYYIGRQAFYGCLELNSINIPESVNEIESQAFGYYFKNNEDAKLDNLTISCVFGSAAHQYAVENEVKYIAPAHTVDLSDCTVSFPKAKYTYTGKAIKPQPIVKYNYVTLKSSQDYVIRYENNIEAGTASVIISGRGNFKGTVTKTFSIVKSTVTDISKCDITLSKNSFEYTGYGIKPRVTVKYGSQTLESGSDYVIKYENNICPGTASVIVAGKGKYTGRVEKNFIVKKNISECQATIPKTDYKYTGNMVKPKVTVWDNDKLLEIGTDYAVRYVNSIEPGSAAVVVSGKGQYSGTININFSINM